MFYLHAKKLTVCQLFKDSVITPEPHARALPNFFVHIAYVRGSVLLRHVDDRPHRLSGVSAGRGDGSAQRGRSVIYYDCLVNAAFCYQSVVVFADVCLRSCVLSHSY